MQSEYSSEMDRQKSTLLCKGYNTNYSCLPLKKKLAGMYEGLSEIIQTFCSFSKTVIYFSKTLFILSQSIPSKYFLKVFPQSLCTFAIFVGVFCSPFANHKVDLLLRYQLTVEIKATLISYLFPASLYFQFWKQIKVPGARSWLYRGWYSNCRLKELISSTVDEAV